MDITILTIEMRTEHDIVLARQRARQIAGLLGFPAQDGTRIATAVSEIARNAFTYAGGGKVEFRVHQKVPPQMFQIHVRDTGPGIENLPDLLADRSISETDPGFGLIGAKRLMDYFHLESAPGQGTTVLLGKILPANAPVVVGAQLARIADELAQQGPQSPLEEVQQQNQELLRTLDDLRNRQEELLQINRELEDTNRGVLALYAELDERALQFKRANEVKSRFIANMTHEFGTPLNSILALSQILLDRLDGGLTAEQEKQVTFIRKSAEVLSQLVNDLLDIAKIEAGKTEAHSARFKITELFSSLRGMFKPIQDKPAVELVFEEPHDMPPLETDENKVAQILRNLIANALKFTESGEVRVSVTLSADGKTVIFTVADTGIGIASEDQERIFEEFTQLPGVSQPQKKGTGLGLPLSKKLAELLGGSLSVKSGQGMGATFTAVIPLVYEEVLTASPGVGNVPPADETG